MPDSNSPWTPDDAFWDEAWTDMETRLDRKRQWRRLLPLLLLLVITGAGALVLWLPGTPPPGAATTGIADAAVNRQPPPASGQEPVPGESPPASTPIREGTAPETDHGYPQVATDLNIAISPSAPAPAPAAPRLPGNPTRAESAAPAAVEFNPSARLSVVEAIPSPTVLGPIHTKEITLPHIRNDHQPFATAHLRQPFGVSMGATTYAGSYHPGGYTELAHHFPAGSWFVPVALRYDYGRRGVRTDGVTDPREFFGSNAPVPSTGMSSALAREEFRQARELKTHSLALRAGLGRRMGPRLSLSGGLQGDYLLGGSGPTYAMLDSAGVVSVTVTEERFSRSGYGGGGQFDLAAGGGGNRSVLTPVLNRLSLSAWLRADYRLAGQLHLTLGTTRHLTPVYREDSPVVERQRLELGLRWGG